MAKKTPQLLSGFRDFGSEQTRTRSFMLDKICASFERFGFEPMETPALEYTATLLGKYGTEEKLMYRFVDLGGREVALRYDLTVPLARFYQINKSNLPKPFKRYAIGSVWRAESPQAGRFREFYQCDVDCVGSYSALADAEVIAVVAQALSDLGIESFKIRLNNRKIIDGVLKMLKVPPTKFVSVMRALDKLDKVGEKKVKNELVAAGLKPVVLKELLEILSQSATDGKGLQDVFSQIVLENPELAEGVGELSDVLDALISFEIKNVVVDLKLARGLDYYTGTVCEIVLSELPQLGSIAGGGRYNRLIGEMSGGKEKIPAVGMSIGLDRLYVALEELELAKYDSKLDVIVFNIDAPTEVYLEVVRELRQVGINCDFYYDRASLDKQFRFAEKKRINLAIIIGKDEIKDQQVVLKNLVTRKQWKIRAEDLITEVEKALFK